MEADNEIERSVFGLSFLEEGIAVVTEDGRVSSFNVVEDCPGVGLFDADVDFADDAERKRSRGGLLAVVDQETLDRPVYYLAVLPI